MQDKEYVSFETAKVLKERGFNELCEAMTTKNGCTWIDYNYNDENSKEVYSLPYVEDAVNWLERNFHYYIARMPRIKDGEVRPSIQPQVQAVGDSMGWRRRLLRWCLGN